MGAVPFCVYFEGDDAARAFEAAVEDARHEYGTGSIAEKTEFVVIVNEPKTLAEAQALGDHLIAVEDPRVADPYGPAGAIPVRGGQRTWFNVQIPPLPSGYENEAAAIAAAMESKLTAGETIAYGTTGVYDMEPERYLASGIRAKRRIVGGTIDVPTENADTLTGWWFFGWTRH